MTVIPPASLSIQETQENFIEDVERAGWRPRLAGPGLVRWSHPGFTDRVPSFVLADDPERIDNEELLRHAVQKMTPYLTVYAVGWSAGQACLDARTEA